MDALAVLDIFLHIDRHLLELAQFYPNAIYALLFLIVFCETGLVITPFLPGDSLLFAVGALAGIGALNAWDAFLLLTVAAIAGDGVNYWAGRHLGPRIFRKQEARLLNRKHLDQTYEFYERHGQKTIILARFVPIVRTFAPFVAGMGKMNYSRFAATNVIGALAWVGICLGGGFFWGNLPFVKQNFSLVILAVVFVSLLPALAQLGSRKLREPKPQVPLPRKAETPEG